MDWLDRSHGIRGRSGGEYSAVSRKFFISLSNVDEVTPGLSIVHLSGTLRRVQWWATVPCPCLRRLKIVIVGKGHGRVPPNAGRRRVILSNRRSARTRSNGQTLHASSKRDITAVGDVMNPIEHNRSHPDSIARFVGWRANPASSDPSILCRGSTQYLWHCL